MLLKLLKRIADKRPPDLEIGPPNDRYMLRWWVIPRNKWFNIYLHHFLHSDDDRALHDHMYFNMSVLLEGQYTEHCINAGGVHVRKEYKAGNILMRGPWKAHRVELTHGQCWTLFVTGPRVREWGFHCEKGWRPWQKFVNMQNPGENGPGCEG